MAEGGGQGPGQGKDTKGAAAEPRLRRDGCEPELLPRLSVEINAPGKPKSKRMALSRVSTWLGWPCHA